MMGRTSAPGALVERVGAESRKKAKDSSRAVAVRCLEWELPETKELEGV